ncbi:ABC transporter permease [Leucobacter sp. UT-8R-CII-1-4]|uniref:ABC transporter permease n=1 Tax=Leucobacter sp. UT-8R-CII-1-4 TaxID=3040075 RepID=UPI0024A9591F|nr:ABC transporter permease [Leucobacter sp. UT-8R-CII-1-4]MDI6023185.1 ABC transporter permease [Leucobacter sp. UT-8R-CII-1-4]
MLDANALSLSTHKANRMPIWLGAILLFTLGFLILPLIVIILFSFNSSQSLSRLEGFSLRWYETAFGNPDVVASLGMSLGIAAGATALAVLIGTGLAWAFARGHKKATTPVEGLTLTTLITPELATAIGLLTLFAMVQIELSWLTVLIGHTTFALVYVTVIMGNRIRTMDRALEEAAYDLGASGLDCFRFVILPSILPAVLSAAALAFVLSFGDFVTSVFLTGSEISPLPVRIYGMLRFGLTPEINAIGSALTLVTVLIGILGVWLATRNNGKRQ